jgi:hypothetical protein
VALARLGRHSVASLGLLISQRGSLQCRPLLL